jgi:hypothetical protein
MPEAVGRMRNGSTSSVPGWTRYRVRSVSTQIEPNPPPPSGWSRRRHGSHPIARPNGAGRCEPGGAGPAARLPPRRRPSGGRGIRGSPESRCRPRRSARSTTRPVSGSIIAIAEPRGSGGLGSSVSRPRRSQTNAPTASTPPARPAIRADLLALAGKMSRLRAAACSASSGGATSAPSTPVTLERWNSPSSPFSRWTPCSANVMPAPETISRTDDGTSTSPGPPTDITRAAVFTTRPPGFLPAASSWPKLTPARISIPSSRTASVAATAQRIASAGRSNVTKNPSPAVSISRPPNRPIWCRTIR